MVTVTYRNLGTLFTILKEKPPDGCTWSGERVTTFQTTSSPDHSWLELCSSMSKSSSTVRKAAGAIEKPKLDIARMLRSIYFIDPVQTNHEQCAEEVGFACEIGHATQGPEPPVQGRLRQRTQPSQIKACKHRGSS